MSMRTVWREMAALAGAFTFLLGFNTAMAAVPPGDAPPNVILILTDDQGYNDLGCFGSPSIKTPRIDQLAREGMRFTDFYAPAPVCTPTRAALLTGCYPQRIGMMYFPNERADGTDGHVLFTRSRHGLNPDEITIAEILKARGYATAIIGKWHLGDAPEFLPTRQGFDSYFGIPYSNDMQPSVLMRDEKVIEEPVDQDTLTRRYTEEALKFINEKKDEPFFLYLAHNMPHTPIHASQEFRGKSARGLYGDVVEELDWSTGKILDALNELNLDERTLVLFSSDNGPWHMRSENGGSATPLRAGKGTTYEGGMRVPTIARWPGHVPAGVVCREMLSHLDLLPTIAALAGATQQLPTDRVIDGKDISPILLGKPDAKSPHEAFYYFADGSLNAVRSGKWKLKLETTWKDEQYYVKVAVPDARVAPALYNLEQDPGEQKNVFADHPDVVERLRKLAGNIRQELGDRRRNIPGSATRPVGRLNHDPRATSGPAASSKG